MEKKEFICPEAIIIEFDNDDIITGSGVGAGQGQDFDDWTTDWNG